jgi:multiple sugar transport system substrate-binding protein
MKVQRAILLSVLILATVFSAFAQKAAASPAKEKIVWVAYGYLAQNKADRIAADFTAKYPQYEVQYVDLGSKDYLMRLDTMVTSGERVDMALAMDSIEYTNRAREGMFLPMDKLVTEDGFNLKDAFGDGLAPSYINGKLYGLPYTKGGFYVFYNKDMFDAAGLKYPTDEWTWDDFEKIAKTLTTGSGAKKIYGANIHMTWGYDIDSLPAQMAG